MIVEFERLKEYRGRVAMVDGDTPSASATSA